MDPPDFEALESALHELWSFLTGDALRNLLASGRVLADIARAIYHYVVTATTIIDVVAHDTQAVTASESATVDQVGGE